MIYAITCGMGQIFWRNFADKHGAKFTLTICCVKLIADSSEEGKAVTGNGVLITFLALGAATATVIMGIMTGLYFMVASMVATLILLVMFA